MDPEQLDPEILKHLPANCSVLATKKHGKPNWSTGYRIHVVDAHGEEHGYFIKIFDRARGDEMARGEYESQKALMDYIPHVISAPIAWGTFQDDPTHAFYLTHFRCTREELPELSDLMAIIKKLHNESVSPTGKSGFHVTTFFGPPPMDNTWTDSWEEYFRREFASSVACAQFTLGNDPELADLSKEITSKIIRRLLRPLQTGGRSIKPTLCFGDFYDANVQVDDKTKEPFLFDPCSFYGHNEMDLQCMRAARNALNQDFVRKYGEEVGISDPVKDFDDRNALYALRNELHTVGMYPKHANLADRIKTEMRGLLKKHPNGLDDFVEEEPCGNGV